MTLDILDRLIDVYELQLQQNKIIGFLPTLKITVDVLEPTVQAICFQYVPSMEPIRYYDRTRQQDLNILVQLKHEDQRVAINAIMDIFEGIENLDSLPSQNNSYEFIGATAYTTPQLVQFDGKNCYIYSGMVTLSFYLH